MTITFNSRHTVAVRRIEAIGYLWISLSIALTLYALYKLPQEPIFTYIIYTALLLFIGALHALFRPAWYPWVLKLLAIVHLFLFPIGTIIGIYIFKSLKQL